MPPVSFWSISYQNASKPTRMQLLNCITTESVWSNGSANTQIRLCVTSFETKCFTEYIDASDQETRWQLVGSFRRLGIELIAP
jgi:hypothetical protein